VGELLNRLKEVVYQPSEKKLHLIFEYVEQDFKKYLDQNKHTLTNYQIKVESVSRVLYLKS
jgi:hypothetical protein